MKTRIIFGAVMIAAITALLWWDYRLQGSGFATVGLPLGILTGLLVFVGFFEVSRLVELAGLASQRLAGLTGTLAIALLPLWRQWLPDSLAAGTRIYLVLPGVVLAMLFFAQMASRRVEGAIRRLAGTIWAVAYLGLLGAAVLGLRIDFGMPAWVLFLASVNLTDIGAYFTGSFLGRHKLIPWLSPGKSWEGLAGGVVAAALVAVVLNGFFKVLPGDTFIIRVWHAAVFGAVLGLVGQFGDLCESLMKRDAGMKDSGALVPGFGGVLDIVDSPLVAAPVAYLLLLAWT
jgi:phosphatidate cytidylyltransferase